MLNSRINESVNYYEIIVACFLHMFVDVDQALKKINENLPAQIRVLGKLVDGFLFHAFFTPLIYLVVLLKEDTSRVEKTELQL